MMRLTGDEIDRIEANLLKKIDEAEDPAERDYYKLELKSFYDKLNDVMCDTVLKVVDKAIDN